MASPKIPLLVSPWKSNPAESKTFYESELSEELQVYEQHKPECAETDTEEEVKEQIEPIIESVPADPYSEILKDLQ